MQWKPNMSGIRTLNKSKNVFLYVLPYFEALNGELLSHNEVKHVQAMVEKLNIQDKEKLSLEIQYGMLTQHTDSGCDKALTKELDFIRIIVPRGGWQRQVLTKS